MNFDKHILETLLNDLVDHDKVEISSIPDIDLYMDQVTTFFDDKLGYLKRNEKDKILTKTMINNYTKSHILSPPTKKKYTKQHMILLTLIYHLKQTLSINDIHSLLSSSVNMPSLDILYSIFSEIECSELTNFKEHFSTQLNHIEKQTALFNNDKKDAGSLFLTVLLLVTQANTQKLLAEKIIDQFFSKKSDLE